MKLLKVKVTIDTNLKMVGFFDVILDLKSGAYRPFEK